MAGGSIELAGLSKHFGNSAAVDNIDALRVLAGTLVPVAASAVEAPLAS
jgi:hypothetical protein